jgi:hypothetical protein
MENKEGICMGFKPVPATTIKAYISGLHSLNLDLKDGTGFDWHFMNYWIDGVMPIKLYGEGQEINTNPIYGYYGIADRGRILSEFGLKVKKVYVADHHRAVLDLVYGSLTKHGMIGYAKGCVEDYFFETDQANELFAQLVKMSPYLEEEERELLVDWLSREFKPFYRSWQAGTLQVGALAGYSPGIIQN